MSEERPAGTVSVTPSPIESTPVAAPATTTSIRPKPPVAKPKPKPTTTRPPAPPPEPYYENCTAARAAGAAPILRGEPGYRRALDADNDGIACESTGGSDGGPAPTTGGSVYYANCDAARAAGAAPIHRGEPGYRSGLDRDGDGIACE